MTETMTRRERDDLAKLVRQRARVEKEMAEQRKAELLAEFEMQVATYYPFDNDETWAEVKSIVEVEIATANARVRERNRELGIPDEFAPSIEIGWRPGGQQLCVERVRELRRLAKVRLEAMEKAARTQIELRSVEVQTRLVAAGLSSTAAQEFLAALPSARDLMPSVDGDPELRKLLPGARGQAPRNSDYDGEPC